MSSRLCSYSNPSLAPIRFGTPCGRASLSTRISVPLYKDHEPVPGIGDDAFFHASNSFADLHVWTGPHHFSIQLGAGDGESAKALKPNAIELAKAIIPRLR